MKKIQKYDRLKKISIEEGFALINSGNPVSQIDEAFVSTAPSLRLQTFLNHGIRCQDPACDLVASFFAIERSPQGKSKHPMSGRYHLNLWGLDHEGNEVLFTCDHILARVLGGSDVLTNTQTMCCWCNYRKGRRESKINEARKAILKKIALQGGLKELAASAT